MTTTPSKARAVFEAMLPGWDRPVSYDTIPMLPDDPIRQRYLMKWRATFQGVSYGGYVELAGNDGWNLAAARRELIQESERVLSDLRAA